MLSRKNTLVIFLTYLFKLFYKKTAENGKKNGIKRKNVKKETEAMIISSVSFRIMKRG